MRFKPASSASCYDYAVTIAFTLPGGAPVYAFSLLVGIGASLGVGRLAAGAPPADRSAYLASAGILLIFTLAGARLFYQFNHPAAAFGLPLAGLSWIGAWIGGLAALLLLPALTGLPFGRLAESLVPTAAALTAAAWLGCWLDGCAYGPVSEAWYALAVRDEWGNMLPRFPTQLLGAVLAILTLALFDILRSRRTATGLAAALWLTLTGLQLWWLIGLRADPGPRWKGFDPDPLAAAALATAGLVFSIIIALRGRSPKSMPRG